MRAVSELTFTVSPGEVVALIGESGSGKSTVGRMALNLLPVSTDWNRRVDGALQAVGLNPQQVRDKCPHQLSVGQLQRLLIARALLLEVRLLVADESISMLDASTADMRS